MQLKCSDQSFAEIIKYLFTKTQTNCMCLLCNLNYLNFVGPVSFPIFKNGLFQRNVFVVFFISNDLLKGRNLVIVNIGGSKGGARDVRPLLGVQILSFSCSFWQKYGKIIAFLGVGAPSSGKSWIRHWLSSEMKDLEKERIRKSLLCSAVFF